MHLEAKKNCTFQGKRAVNMLEVVGDISYWQYPLE